MYFTSMKCDLGLWVTLAFDLWGTGMGVKLKQVSKKSCYEQNKSQTARTLMLTCCQPYTKYDLDLWDTGTYHYGRLQKQEEIHKNWMFYYYIV